MPVLPLISLVYCTFIYRSSFLVRVVVVLLVAEDEADVDAPPLRTLLGGSAFFFPFPIMYSNHRFRFSYQLLPLRHSCHPVSCTLNPGLRARETIPTTPLYYLPRSRQVNLTATVPQRPNASMHIHSQVSHHF
jgi:hypothetical protein